MQTKPTTQPGPYESYFGGKSGSGLAQTIINHIRPHDIYMELFLGNGSVFRMKKPAQLTLLNDLNHSIIVAWGNVANADTTDCELWNENAIDLLARLPFSPVDRYCIYLDPPYPISSRRAERKVYAYEMTDDDHRQLLQVIRYLPDNVDVLISTYENPIYAELLHDWHLIKFQAQTHQGPATELLYMNYVPDGVLHDYRYLGDDRTDRQRIQRKIDRQIARLQRLPAAERNAIIVAVADDTNYHRAKTEASTSTT